MRLPRLTELTLKHWLIIGILCIAAFLRFWNIPGNLQFQGDQGRDALIVLKLIKEGNLVFIGPVTSVGNMYLGPFYYYFMAPFLWLSYPSPLGPVYAIAFLGVVTVYLMYRLGRELVGERAALIASGLTTISAVAVNYSRFSWNPNPAPLVSLILIWATYRAWIKNPWYWTVVGACFGILIQLHYLTLLSGAGAGLIWLVSASARFRTKTLKQLVLPTLVAIGIVGVSLAPLMLFDARHGWLNVKAFGALFTKEEAFVKADRPPPLTKLLKTLKESQTRSLQILFEITVGPHRTLNSTLLVAFTLTTVAAVRFKRLEVKETGVAVLGAYLLTGILGTAFYEHSVFDHYIAYLFPVTFLFFGLTLSIWWESNLGKIAALSCVGVFIWWNVPRWQLEDSNWPLHSIQGVSQSISERVQPGEKYNIVRLSATRDIYAQNYRYFLHTTAHPPTDMHEWDTIDTLFIIDEEHAEPDVTNLPIYEIASFPKSESSESFTPLPGGPEITILRRK